MWFIGSHLFHRVRVDLVYRLSFASVVIHLLDRSLVTLDQALIYRAGPV
jgi:hypothetical protein